jgi:predicted ATPase
VQHMEITVSNYKSIRKAQMKLGRVTVLLGPPAAGKSNLLEAIALATYFDRFALYSDVEPLARLVRTDDVRGLSTYYDAAKTVEISLNGGGWRRSIRIYFQKGLRLELNGVDVPVVPSSRSPHFSYNGIGYETVKAKLLEILREGVAARLYGFERFRDDVVRAMVAGAEAETPPDLLREDGKNFGIAAAKQPEVFRDVNAELKELSQAEVNLLDDGRVVVFDGYTAERPPDSLLRVLYYITALASMAQFAKLHFLEDRSIVLLEEPEVHPRFLHLLVKYIEKFSEVGYVVITTHSPFLVSLLRDRLDATLYYVYRGCTGHTEVAELDKDAMAEEFVTAEDILFMKPREVLRFRR